MPGNVAARTTPHSEYAIPKDLASGFSGVTEKVDFGASFPLKGLMFSHGSNRFV